MLALLAVVGVVSLETLREYRAHILVGLWIASCFVSPGAESL